MKITFVTPRLQKHKFTGGTYCILRHANELQARGHQVSIVATPKSERPKWIDLQVDLIIPKVLTYHKTSAIHKSLIAMTTNALGYIGRSYNGDPHAIASIDNIVRYYIPQSDITIATLWETARLVARYGSGKRAYFCQHHEPIFFEDKISKADVSATYRYGLNIIANSSWLRWELAKIYFEGNTESIHLVNNAIDTNVFIESGLIKSKNHELKIISYGGRGVSWKGFQEMATSVAIARNALPSIDIKWNVYGEAALPPNNSIASYNSLGFLNQEELAIEYSKNDVLLSASWYESFPLFPLEAMACGLAVITTKLGTEDYAINNRNCLIVNEKDPESIALAIIKLSNDRELMKKLKLTAPLDAREFNWNRASDQMEHVLRKIIMTT